ncbi:hypothetical protein CIHG_05659 [Coccidioides immitis H538.4]|uniref:Uncharacterized protein n=1 Tax=Coccidioides immitis H538.4 TaxID=396776 RepID=A0A0J8RSY6_COCIT|nr:hypothetical protein CIHG_05659 [Coccidioides immitis H538.4]
MSKGPGDGANLPPEECGGGLRRVILVVRSAGEARMRWESSWEKRTGDDSLLDELVSPLCTPYFELPREPLEKTDGYWTIALHPSDTLQARRERIMNTRKSIKRASRLISR